MCAGVDATTSRRHLYIENPDFPSGESKVIFTEAAHTVVLVSLRLRAAGVITHCAAAKFFVCVVVRTTTPNGDYKREISIFTVGASPRNSPRTSYPLRSQNI